MTDTKTLPQRLRERAGQNDECDWHQAIELEAAAEIEHLQTALERGDTATADAAITEYWLTNYMADHCTLCGNAGWIDSRGVKTAAGVEVGRVNYCICPNGQALRAGNAWLPLMVEKLKASQP